MKPATPTARSVGPNGRLTKYRSAYRLWCRTTSKDRFAWVDWNGSEPTEPQRPTERDTVTRPSRLARRTVWVLWGIFAVLRIIALATRRSGPFPQREAWILYTFDLERHEFLAALDAPGPAHTAQASRSAASQLTHVPFCLCIRCRSRSAHQWGHLLAENRAVARSLRWIATWEPTAEIHVHGLKHQRG